MDFSVFLGRRVSSIQLPPVVSSWIQSGKKYAKENPMTAVTLIALAISCKDINNMYN